MSVRLTILLSNDIVHDRRMHRIANTLTELGFIVTLLGRQLPDSKRLEMKPYYQKRLQFTYQRGVWFYAELQWRYFHFLIDSKPDVIVAVDLDTLPAACLGAYFLKVPYTLDAHELFPEVPELHDKPRIKKIWQDIEKWFLPHATIRTTVSESIAAYYLKKYNLKFHVIRNVPNKAEPLQEERFNTYYLYQGALNQGRGLEQLIMASQKFKRPLFIAGEGDLSQTLRELAHKYSTPEQVVFLGMLSAEDLNRITSSAYAAVNLIENYSLSYYYSLANKFFDYIQYGIPSVNMSYPEYQKIVAEFPLGILIPDLSEDAILHALELIEDENKYIQMKTACSKAASVFHWEAEELKWIELYEPFLRTAPSSRFF